MPFEPHPTDPNSVIYKVSKYHLPKPWQGLTDDEMDLLVTQAREVPVEIPCDSFTTRLLKLAEQFLKDKNT